MTGNITSTLNPQLTFFLQNQLKWTELNDIQLQTIPLILNHENTLVIAPTASGKTESVLIPIFNEILNNHLKGTSVLYVSPLKALINDMNNRISSWASYFNLSVMKWHGDVSKHKKDRYVKNPSDFLLITPESLEVIFINRSKKDKEKIFKNIKYIIVDEIHYFVDSERGIQLNSLINRICQYTQNVTKIGLSATVGNPETVAKWIDVKNPAKISKTDSIRNFKYRVCDFGEKRGEFIEPLQKYLNEKVLIFANSRKGVENIHYLLKKKSNVQNIYAHHSSIGKEVREKNERKFKENDSAFMISTSTLELGIDIGNIDFVVLSKPTNTVSSFLQRIGRSGRKSKIQRAMLFSSSNFESLVTASEITLLKDNLVENIQISTRAYDIFIHQILSVLFEKGSIKKPLLFNLLHRCYVFSNITKNDYINIIKRLDELKLVNEYHGYISLGPEFEEEFGEQNFLDFYSVFATSREYTVKNGKEEVGKLDPVFIDNLGPQTTFILGGRFWKVNKVDNNKFIIYVSSSTFKAQTPNWMSMGMMLDYLSTRRIYDILLGNFEKEILKHFDDKTNHDIVGYCNYVQTFENLNNTITVITGEEEYGKEKIFIYSFAGGNVNSLLSYVLRNHFKISDIEIEAVFCSFSTNASVDDIINFYNNINNISEEEINNIIDNLCEEDKEDEEETIEDPSEDNKNSSKNENKGNTDSDFVQYLPEELQKIVKRDLYQSEIEDLKDLVKNTKAIHLSDFDLRMLK